MKKIPLIFLFIAVFCCKKSEKTDEATVLKASKAITLKYAKGFTITNFNNYKVLTVKGSWPNAKKTYKYALVNNLQETSKLRHKAEFDAVLKTPIKRIVVTSTTHIPALELLGVTETLVGFPGIDYISSEKIRLLIEAGKVIELGQNEDINTEILLALKPDLVVGFGIDGNNKTFNSIKKAGIPVIYNGEWIEHSPLAKAEWLKFFGVLYNKEERADSIFNKIERNYLEAKRLATNSNTKPTVLSGAMHEDVWYLPSGTSPEAQLLKDANANYLWSTTESAGSLALSFETVYTKAKTAEIWLSPSHYTSLEALRKAHVHYTHFDAFKNKNIFSFVNTKGATGGVTYYEQGTARPDLVLKDLIKICHPQLLPNYQFHFFKPLQ